LVVVGDNRLGVGSTYVHGGFFHTAPDVPEMGVDGGQVSITCSGGTDLTIVTAATALSTLSADPDFAALGIVAGDTLLAYDNDNNVYEDLVVASVSANVITCVSFSTACPVSGVGSSITLLPNRRIQCVGYPDSGDAPTNRLNGPGSCVSAAQVSRMYGFHVKAPAATDMLHSVLEFGHSGGSPLNRIVADVRDDAGLLSSYAVIVHSPSAVVQPLSGQTLTASLSVIGGKTLVEGSGSISLGHFVSIGSITINNGTPSASFGALSVHARSTDDYAVLVSDGGSLATTATMLVNGQLSTIRVERNARWTDDTGLLAIYAAGTCIAIDEAGSYFMRATYTNPLLTSCFVGVSINGTATVHYTSAAATPTTSSVTYDLQQADSARFTIGDIEQRPARFIGASGPLEAQYGLNILEGTGALAMTLTGPLTDYIHRRFVVTSRSAYAHTITLTGATCKSLLTIFVR
jgi:hypothetical protein